MRSARQLTALAGLALGATMTVIACEPCASVGACATGPRVAVQGRIVTADLGTGVANAQVSLVRTGGGARDSVSATTDVNGNYQLTVPGESGKFDIVVAAAGLPAYRVRDLSLTSTTTGGDGHVIGPWVATPRMSTAAELYYRSDPTSVVANAILDFYRTGGADVSPYESYRSFTDAAGRTSLLEGAIASSAEDVIGNILVTLPGGAGQSLVQNIHIKPDYEFRPQTVHRIGVGPQLAWLAAIYDRATVARVPGTRVTFVRTGGIPTSAESFTIVTNAAGEFVIPLKPLAQGTLVGDLTIQPPAPFRSYTRTGLQIPTYDSDENPFFASFGVGPHLPWAGTVVCNGHPLKNATVFVVRVGGIAAEPSSFYATTDADGHFLMATFKPKEYGTLVVDLDISVPPGTPCIGLVQHNVQVPTIDFDSDLRFLSTWELPH